jgi:spore germination protein KB
MQNQPLTVRQATIWCIMHNTGNSILIIPAALASLAKQDAWISVLLATAMQLALAPVLILVGKQMNGKTFMEYLSALFGKIAAGLILAAVIVFVPLLTLAASLRNLGDFITTVFIPETPIEIVHFTFLMVVIYSFHKGISALGGAVEVMLPTLVLLMVVLLVTLSPRVDPHMLMPVMEKGWRPILHGALILWGLSFSGQIMFLFFLPHLPKGAKLRPLFVDSTILSGIPIMLVTAFAVMTFSATGTSWLSFPSYSMASVISIGEFFERVESMIAFIWIVVIFYRVSLYMLASSSGIAQIFGLKDSKYLVIPLALFIYKLCEIIWSNVVSDKELVSVWPYYSASFGIALPLLLLVAGRVRRKSLKQKLA